MPNALSRLVPWLAPQSPKGPATDFSRAGASQPIDTKASRTGALFAIEHLRRPVWTPRDFAAFAREGYMQNAIVYRSVRMVAEAAASVPLLLYDGDNELTDHPLLDLIANPAPQQTGTDFFEAWVGYLLVAGNAYAEAVSVDGEVRELHVLRPDRMKVIPGADGWPEAYEYTVNGASVRFDREVAEDIPPILHLRLFHPANDYYGMSPLEAASTAIDIHNTATQWNKALLDNSARPSGALVYTGGEGRMTTEQFERLRDELENGFQGARQAGRPLLLEGGLDWKALGLSPRDMDFIEAKHAAAREIALAIGVPPMLLGIPGDNTYSNYQEAQRAFWRQTVLPLFNRSAKAIAAWLSPAWGGPVDLRGDLDQIEALTSEREALWARLQATSFLTDDEKRAAIGYGPMPEAEPQDDSAALPPLGGADLSAKYNPYHDELGRFTEADNAVEPNGGARAGGGGSSGGAGDAATKHGVSDQVAMVLWKLFRNSKTSNFKFKTRPTSAQDLFKPKGRPGTLKGNRKDLTRDEDDFIDEMLQLGNDVELVPSGKRRTPDFKINGQLFELKTLTNVKRTDEDGLSGIISNRSLNARSQSPRVIIDGRKIPSLTKKSANRGIDRAIGGDSARKIDEITVLTPNGPVFRKRH